MARTKSGRRNAGQSVTATPRVSSPSRPKTTVLNLRPIEDRRTFHPLGDVRPAKKVSGHAVSPMKVAVKVRPGRKLSNLLPHKIQFAVPSKTIICLRRRARKIMMIVNGGRGSRRKKRRNYYSGVKC